MIAGVFLILAGAVMLYLAIVNTDLRDVAEGFLNGTVIRR